MKDLLRAEIISGASMALIAGLFFVEIGSKTVVEHAADLVTGANSEARTDSPQMDRYTESEAEGLDKLIEDKSK